MLFKNGNNRDSGSQIRRWTFIRLVYFFGWACGNLCVDWRTVFKSVYNFTDNQA